MARVLYEAWMGQTRRHAQDPSESSISQFEDAKLLVLGKEWTVESHLKMMEDNSIDKCILSVTAPGTHLIAGDRALAKEVTMKTNDELSEIAAAHPDKFKFFASLPLPEVEESLEEIDRALDKLGAVGFCVMSNANGVYMGDAKLDPVFKKLNERKAIVFIHPCACKLLMPNAQKGGEPSCVTVAPLPQLPRPIMEYFFDESRAVVNLLTSGTMSRNEDLRLIMSHGGGVLPPTLERVTSFSAALFGKANTGQELREIIKSRIYFDLAGKIAVMMAQLNGHRLTSNNRLAIPRADPRSSPHFQAGAATIRHRLPVHAWRR